MVLSEKDFFAVNKQAINNRGNEHLGAYWPIVTIVANFQLGKFKKEEKTERWCQSRFSQDGLPGFLSL